MALDQATLEGLSGAEQIIVLKSLKQQSAAWLLNLTARSLRDHVEVPRHADGHYDARELLTSGLQTTALPEPTPDELEKLWQVAESLAWDDLIPASLCLLKSLQERHGTVAGLALFAQAMLEVWAEQHERDEPEPTESEFRSKAEKRFEEELQRHRNHQLRQQLRVITVCGECKRIRRGRQWVKGHISADSLASESMCPGCEEKQRQFDALPAGKRREILALKKAGLTAADLVD